MVSDNHSMLMDATISKTRKMVIVCLSVLLVAVIGISLSLSIPQNLKDHYNDHNETSKTPELNEKTTAKNIFDSTIISTTSPTINTSITTKVTTISSKTLNPKLEDICGRRYFKHRQKRIVGGVKAQAHAWPWQVVFKTATACGATILTRFWIITAAHCLYNDNGTFIPISEIKVILGEHNRRAKNEEFESVERSIAQAIVHQGYNHTDAQSDFDLALLRLDSPIDFQPNIIPICLPTGNDDDFSGLTGTVTGWGRLHPDIEMKPDLLRQVELPILTNENCASMTQWRITNNSLCAGYKNGGKDFCSGDSGGPLTVKDANDRYVLAGVVSGGPCGQPAGPGIYMRVSRFLDWISNHTDY